MKKLITYGLFTEGIKDLMTPKSEEEIRKTLESKPLKDKIEFGIRKDIPWLIQQGIEEGADTTDNIDFLLVWATEKGQMSLVKLLLDKGADIHTDDDKPLRNACYYGYLEIVRFLIEKGANVNADRGYLLSLPVQKGYYEITEMLLKSGATKKIDYAIRLAMGKNLDDIVKLLQKYQHVNESVKDLMTGKSIEDIKKDLSKIDPDELLGKLYDMEIDLTDIFSEDEILELDPEVLLQYSFYNNYVKGIKYVLDNYRLYGKDTRFTVSSRMPDIKDDDDLAYLLKDHQIRKFLKPDQIYILEKYRVGMHQDETRDYEQRLIDKLDITVYYQSKSDPNIMIGKNKKGDKNYFNYNKESGILTYHLDNFVSWLIDEDDEDDHESHRGDKFMYNEYGIYGRYLDVLFKGLIGKYYGIKIDRCTGSRNDDYSFVKE